MIQVSDQVIDKTDQTSELRDSKVHPPEPHIHLLVHLLVLAGSIAGFAFYSVALGKDSNYDLLNYHYYNGYALLTGSWRTNGAPAQIQTYFSPTLDAICYWLTLHVRPVTFAKILGGLQGLNFWLVFEIAAFVIRLRNRWLSWCLWLACPALAMYSPTSLGELGTWMGDLTTSVPTLAGVLLLVAASGGDTTRRSHRISMLGGGLLLGAATGLKLTCAPYALAAFVAFVLLFRLREKATLALFLGGAAVGFLLFSAYWLVSITRKFGNPIFPLYNNIFRSPFALPLNPPMASFFPKTLRQWLFLPFYFTSATTHALSELRFEYIGFAIIYVAVLLALISLLLRAAMSRRTLTQGSWWEWVRAHVLTHEREFRFAVFFVLAFVLWEVFFSIYRYLSPLELLAPVMICLLIGTLIRPEIPRLIVSLAVLGLIGWTMTFTDWGREVWTDSYFSAQVPRIENPENAVVVMASSEPMSYLVPSFAKDVRFVRVRGSLHGYVTPSYLEQERQLISSRSGPFYLMTSGRTLDVATKDIERILSPHHLQLERQTCTQLPGTIQRFAPIYMCNLTRSEP